MGDYWNNRFGSGGKVWGEKPSGTAEIAKDIFQKNNIDEVLVIGSGYGRNTNYFFDNGFNVEGIEFSKEGIDIAREDNPKIIYYHGSAFDVPFRHNKYSAIYCYNVIHLFTKEKRNELLEKCNDILKEDGTMFFTGFSVQEASYGTGEEIEENTYETKKGKPIHFYSINEMKTEFNQFKIIESGNYIERENHGLEGEHEHVLSYIVVKK